MKRYDKFLRYLFLISVACTLILFSCKKKPTAIPEEGLVVGMNYQGGVIAYVFKAGDPGYVDGEVHGLIAASEDQDTAIEWGCYGTLLYCAWGTEMGDGKRNTQELMDSCVTDNIAAKICGNLVLNGYSDWYLPSKKELSRLYESKEQIGGFTYKAHYWSSSQYDTNQAWQQRFSENKLEGFGKVYPCHVRAVRNF